MPEWHAIEERFDPTWEWTFKWGYDDMTGRVYGWQFTGEGDGSVTHRAELAQRFGRPVNVRNGDQLGVASYIPEERKLDGTLVAPPEVQLHGYYGAAIHPSVIEHFETKFPGVVVRRASTKTSKIRHVVGPDTVQIETDTYEHPHQELAEVKADLAKQFPHHEILLPNLPEDIFAGRPSLLDREQRREAVRQWIARSLPNAEPLPVEPYVYPSLKQSLFGRLLKRSDADMEGAMVAVFIPREVGKKIRVKGGEPLDLLHITLAYFTDKSADRDDWNEVEKIVKQIAAQHPNLVGRIGGYGVFSNDEDILWASPSIPGLAELRHKVVEACEDAGFMVSDEHGWTPHITLEYGFEGDLPKLDGDLELTIESLSFAQGADKQDFPFEGHFEKTTGLRGDLPFGLEIKIEENKLGPEYGEDEGTLMGWTAIAYLSGHVVGSLDTDGYTINGVSVEPAYQRMGIATALLRAAESHVGGKIEHSHDLTGDGQAWAEKTSLWEQNEWSWPGAYRFVTDGKEVALEPEDKSEWKGADLDPLGEKFRSHHPDSEPSVSGWAVPTQDGMGYGIWAPTVGYGGENQLGMHDLVATLDKEFKKPTHLVEDWREMTNPDQYSLSLDS